MRTIVLIHKFIETGNLRLRPRSGNARRLADLTDDFPLNLPPLSQLQATL